MEEALRLLDIARAWAVWAPLLGLGALLGITLVRLTIADVTNAKATVARIRGPASRHPGRDAGIGQVPPLATGPATPPPRDDPSSCSAT